MQLESINNNQKSQRLRLIQLITEAERMGDVDLAMRLLKRYQKLRYKALEGSRIICAE